MAAHDAASIGGAGPRRVDQRLLQILQVVALLLVVLRAVVLVLTRPEGISLLLVVLTRRREVGIILHVADGGGGRCLGYAPVAPSLILNLGNSRGGEGSSSVVAFAEK